MDPLSFINNKPDEKYNSEGKKIIKSIESHTLDRCPDCNFKMSYCDKVVNWLSNESTCTEYTFYCKRCEQNTFVEVSEGVTDFDDDFEWNLNVSVSTQKSLNPEDSEITVQEKCSK